MKPRPEILLCPNIPKPLHGIAPRVIKGKEWWDTVRQQAYASTDYHCAACGVLKTEALYHHWLEAHELYSFDYPKGRMEMIEIVPLCHACHNFIHSGRLLALLNEGRLHPVKYDTIIQHGRMIIKANKLVAKYGERHTEKCANWKEWRLVLDGKLYGPSSASLADWKKGSWRNWTPPTT